MNEKEHLDHYLARLASNTSANIQVVERKDVGDLYHISLDPKIKEFIPFMTQRTAPKEDRTVPRVSTAPTLIGCFIGYGSAMWDFERNTFEEQNNKGGWYVYDFDFEFALRPKKKLLDDVGITDEVWLVNYSPKTAGYKGKIIAKVFYHSVKLTAVEKNGFNRDVEMYIEVYDKPLQFDPHTSLEKGFWRILGPEQSNLKSYKHTKGKYEFQSITKAEFTEKKKISASLLSLGW